MTLSLIETLNLGITYFQENNFEKAESMFQAVLQLDKNNADALHLLGVLRQQQGETAEAVTLLEKAVAQSRNNVSFLANLSNSLIFLEEYKKAEKYCQRILKLNSAYGPVYYHLARISFLTENLPKAVEYCEQAIELGQHSEHVFLLLARVFLEQKDLAGAERAYRQAITINSDLSEAYNGLGRIYFMQGHIQKAYSMFYQALKKDSQNIDALYNQGIVLRGLGRLEEAVEVLSRAVQLDPGHINALAGLGLSRQELGQTVEAEAVYSKVLQIAPDNGLANHMLSAIRGQRTACAPADFVTELFDAYASGYEDHLQSVLEFKAPKLISDAIKLSCGKLLPFAEVLDLGCGTGLVAEKLGSCAEIIDGVDLAEKMLAIAASKDLYRDLEKSAINSFLQTRIDQYDCCIASDVFIYIGGLEETFAAVFNSLKAKGVFAFTTEDSFEPGFELKESGRYAHSSAYILSLAELCGFEVILQDKVNLRKENNEWLSGQIYILQKA